MSASIELKGLQELEGQLLNLLEVGGKPSRVLNSAGRRAWQVPLEEAQRLCPYDIESGEPHLRDHIAITVKRTGKWFSGNIVHVSGLMIRAGYGQGRRALNKIGKRMGVAILIKNPRRYYHLVEWGTARSAAHPFIRPAVDPHAAKIVAEFRDTLARGVKKALEYRQRISGESFEP